jgi:hypothetical protein
MQKLLKLTLGLLTLGTLAALSGPAQAQTTGNGPYYATPSWDQTLPVSTRFITLSNFSSQAVLDRETGLVWEQSPDATPRNLRQAASACHNKVIGRRKGWRLPTIAELTSLVDPSQVDPALPVGHPFTNVRFGGLPFSRPSYWSSSSFPEEATGLLPPLPLTVDTEILDLSGGTVGVTNSKANERLSWCVRGVGGHNGR